MCGTEQSKIILETGDGNTDFKLEKEEIKVSPFEQYMRQKEEAQAEGDLVFEKNPHAALAVNATSRFGKDRTKTNSNNRFYTTKQIDVVNNDTQKDASILAATALIKTIQGQQPEGVEKQISRFATVAGSSGADKIQGLRTASSNQIFSLSEWNKNSSELGEGLYEDHDFPASDSVIIGNVKLSGLPKKLDYLNQKCQNIKWIKATQIDPEIQVVVDGIDPTDVIQGQLNNSYFLCAVSAVSEYQNRIQRLILQQDQADNGAYGFAINQVGNWKMITVDDNLPLIKIDDKKYKFLGANSVNAEIWVPLIEKAYAKAYNGYDIIGNGGDMRHALTDLTGAPSETFFLKDFEDEINEAGRGHVPYGHSGDVSKINSLKKLNDDEVRFIPQNFGADRKRGPDGNVEPSVTVGNIQTEAGAKRLWNLVKNADINRHIICAGTRPSSEIADEYFEEFKTWSGQNEEKSMEHFSIDHFGLYPAFSYTVIGIAEYSGEKLIRLRNPKGVTEWKGEWGDHSDKWSSIQPEFRAEIKEDGIFYMPFHEFANFFHEITINYYDDSYVHTAFQDRLHKDTMNVYDVTISTPGEYFFSISQKDKRSKGSTGGLNSKFPTKLLKF